MCKAQALPTSATQSWHQGQEVHLLGSYGTMTKSFVINWPNIADSPQSERARLQVLKARDTDTFLHLTTHCRWLNISLGKCFWLLVCS